MANYQHNTTNTKQKFALMQLAKIEFHDPPITIFENMQ